jgi:esterase/lipase superfamily enzyme
VLDREMNVACWGDFGKPVLLFPTAGGDFLECERFLMIRVLTPLIEARRIKVYSCASISGDGWLEKDAPPWVKSKLQARFDAYLVQELLPFIRHDCGGSDLRFCATGASIGAYNALNAATKHPQYFDLCISMSGTYFFERWMSGHWDQDYYFNMPVQWLPKLGESDQLHRLRTARFIIASGAGRAEAPDESVKVSQILDAKGIPNHLELWGPEAHHDWPTWRTMLPMFLEKVV